MEKNKSNQGTLRHKASSKDVLGITSSPKEQVPPKWRHQYSELVELRERLLNRRGELVRDASEEQPAFSLHMADAGTDNFDRDFALSMASSEQSALYEIEQALNRMRDGTYGVCELTGKAIAPDRLKAIPWARFSADAEKELEREGSVQRARFAPLEMMPKGVETGETEENEPEEV